MVMMRLRAQPNESDSDRWEAQLRKGALEMAALASLWSGRLYGLEIIRFLENHSRLVLAEGLPPPGWFEPEAGLPRKYYTLTQAGRTLLRTMAEAWAAFSAALNRLLA